MRLTEPRLPPLADDELDAEFKAAIAPLSPSRVLNIYRTLGRSPQTSAAFLPWAKYILSRRNDLPPREREIVILRTGFLCKSGYEWTQHTRIGRREGLTADEIEALKIGVGGLGWSDADAALIRAADDLHRDQFLSDATWAALSAHFTEQQCMAVVYTAGQYVLVAMLLNSFGVQLDEGQVLDPDLAS